MANANQTPEEFLAFSAYLAESTQVEVEFALGADARVSLLTCLAALGLFIVGTLVFVIRYLGKGPRELLPRAESKFLRHTKRLPGRGAVERSETEGLR